VFRTRERTSSSELLSHQASVVLLYTHMSVTREATDKLHKLLSITQQRIYKLYINLKFITLKPLKCSYMFRYLDHPQGARIVPC
jgi:hypothetical protein